MTRAHVYRLEHIKHCDAERKNHGPYKRYGCSNHYKPFFGEAGRGPLGIAHGEICGVTPLQARYWWSIDHKPAAYEIEIWRMAGWEFVHYRVPAEHMRINNGQIVFTAKHAERVGPVGFPAFLLTDRRTTWDSRNRWHMRERERDRRQHERAEQVEPASVPSPLEEAMKSFGAGMTLAYQSIGLSPLTEFEIALSDVTK